MSTTPATTSGDATVEVDGPVAAMTAAPLRAGATLARYLVIGELGEGGMGRVLRAYDPKLQREVALKVLRPRSSDDSAERRLVREARAMARLAHPNVVSVYDVEVDPDHGVVLAMQYVAGTTLRTWLDTSRAPEAVLAAFGEAGRGLQAAHEAGLLHRDFKPDNVLVAGDGRVLVTDFGIARHDGSASEPAVVTGEDATSFDDGLLTRSATGIVMGTPPYMAPEQHDGAELTPATDQYAFCIALWEGLCGARPFRSRGPALVDDKRDGPPPWPTGVSVDARVSAAIRRGLAPEPADRWPGMRALLAELAPRPKTTRRIAVAVIGLMGLGSVIALSRPTEAAPCTGAADKLTGIWDAPTRDAVAARFRATTVPFAEAAWSGIAPRLQSFADEWVAQHTDACEATTVRGEQSAEALDLRMACLARARTELDATVAALRTADRDAVARAHDIVDGLPRLAACADISGLQQDIEPPSPREAAAVETARRALADARTAIDLDRLDAAADALARAETAAADVEYPPLAAELVYYRGAIAQEGGRYEDAEAPLTEAMRRALTIDHAAIAHASLLRLTRVVGEYLARYDTGLAYGEVARGLAARNDDPLATARTQIAIATVHLTRGDPGRAAGELRAALALMNDVVPAPLRTMATAHSNLGNALRDLGRYGEGELESRAAFELWREALGPSHPQLARSRNNIATTLIQQGRYDAAVAELRASIEDLTAAFGPDHPDVALPHYNLALALQDLGELEDAEAHARLSLEIRQAALGPVHARVAESLSVLGDIQRAAGRFDDAEQTMRRALAMSERTQEPDHPMVAATHHELAGVLRAQRRLPEAEAEYRRALAIMVEARGPRHVSVAAIHHELGELLLFDVDPSRAVAEFEAEWDIREASSNHGARAGAAWGLAMALRATDGDPIRIAQLAEQAIADYRAGGHAYADVVPQVEAWLREK